MIRIDAHAGQGQSTLRLELMYGPHAWLTDVDLASTEPHRVSAALSFGQALSNTLAFTSSASTTGGHAHMHDLPLTSILAHCY